MPDVRLDGDDGATFDKSGEYRYSLWRRLDAGHEILAFVMLNPSTATHEANDQTVRRCVGYARDWGYDRLLVGNIFALRARDPDELYEHPDPVGPMNDHYLEVMSAIADRTVVAWGDHGAHLGRGREVIDVLEGSLYALDTNQSGHPTHPLYQPKDTEPEPFEFGEEE